ncbi:hypothetical protein CJ030_MR7G000713 [Morella rubra]|uniref:Phosphatidylinositol-specific phospholipase C X domain-containing protein n=1 Tax=Morella rubra TaxID=262757 RepID=A0A6A1V400_9ROSI|nr:hypothetical protein CJ030_MR7G000713 [Morella rubra]
MGLSPDRKNWMSGLNPEKIQVNQIENRRVCHGILVTYNIDVVIKDIKRFLSETQSEIIILEIRTECGHQDPPEFETYLVEQLGDFLIHQDEHVFGKTIAELLPKRIICVWKPRKSPHPKPGSPLWSAGYLKDNWIDTDLPSTKFESNLKHLSEQPPVSSRKFFYRVENTVTPQPNNPVLVRGTRVIDIRVQENRRVCHGILVTYNIDVVIKDIKRFLSETQSEIIILEIRTECGHQDPPEFETYLVEQLGDFLIHQDEHVFGKTIAELLPKRIICVWKPRKSPHPKPGSPLWSAGYLKDNWIDTDLPSTKFESNLKHLSEQPPVSSRKFFYRVENTVTPQPNNPVVCVKPVTKRIHKYARLFITQCFSRGFADRLQIFSTDFIDEDFVDACVGVTHARVEGKA